MAMLVNGEYVADELIEAEVSRLAAIRQLDRTTQPGEASVSDQDRLRAACALVDRILIRQAAERDQRPLDSAAVEAEMREQMRQASCRTGVNEPALRRLAEQTLRVRRVTDDLAGDFAGPGPEEVLEFFHAFRDEFGKGQKVRASHIIVHVNKTRSEAEAQGVIRQALAALDRGMPFAEAAEKFSDCKGDGGDLGFFSPGEMVEEFDRAVLCLMPGESSGIFRTPFGFHIARLDSVSTGETRDPGHAQRQIEAYLLAKRRHEALDRGLDQFREEAVIEHVPERAG